MACALYNFVLTHVTHCCLQPWYCLIVMTTEVGMEDGDTMMKGLCKEYNCAQERIRTGG